MILKELTQSSLHVCMQLLQQLWSSASVLTLAEPLA